MTAPSAFVCHGCGAEVDPRVALPFRCPGAARGDGVDHVLAPRTAPAPFIPGPEDDPFLRYRALLSPYRLARAAGLSDAAFTELHGALDAALVRVDGGGFRRTPAAPAPALARAAGAAGLWVKDETGGVAGSHKARHLMGVLLHLRVLEAARLPPAEGLRARRLAIASCGNAALAAAVVARAAEWPLDVFIPPSASAAVVARLRELGATVNVCDRRAGEAGDPCFLRFQEAVQRGAIPFGVQGTENGLAIEGCRTLAWELAEQLRDAGATIDSLYVQVGGGAFASALAQGLAIAAAAGVLARVPRLVAVQTAACAPLARAWERLGTTPIDEAARDRGRFMWAWEEPRSSEAEGILDDETYDWWEIARGLRATGGTTVVAPEQDVVHAHALAREHTAIPASATGTAGLAGLLAEGGAARAAVVFSGVER